MTDRLNEHHLLGILLSAAAGSLPHNTFPILTVLTSFSPKLAQTPYGLFLLMMFVVLIGARFGQWMVLHANLLLRCPEIL